VPVGFLSAHLLMQEASATRHTPLLFLAGVFSVALAFGVEFTQIFFPPRTVSLNDLLAETVGSLIGLLLAARYSDWFKKLLNAIFSDPRRLTLRLVEAYFAGYLAFSLFPYDVLLSGAELKQKIAGDSWGWLLAGETQGGVLIVVKSLSEIILTLPFGLFLGHWSGRQSANYKQAILFGALLGGFIEIAQFFTASGVSQGLSVLTRIAGVYCGLTFWERRANWSPERLAALAQRYALPLSVVYLLVLLQANGWFSHHWDGADYAFSRLGELHFLPFYYHYYTSEAKALFSLASVCLMYLPVGLLVWSVWGSPAQAFSFALFIASLVESGKLFLHDVHPDPTNVGLAALAAWGTVHLARTLSEAATMPSITTTTGQNTAQPGKRVPKANDSDRRWTRYAILLPSLGFTAYWAANFPTQPSLLCLFLAASAAIVWRRPALVVAILPAALPILDLAPWSGRFFLDEFDLLVIICLAIGYARVPPVASHARRWDTLFALAASLAALSLTISAMRGLTPWPAPDANAFTNYYSPYNALRVGKGALWAFLGYGLLRRLVAAGMDVRRPLALGMTTGLALTVTVILWERWTFDSLLDFAGNYRVTGPFSSMHTGGAYIECFLALATPFLVLLIVRTQNWISKLLGIVLLLAATYSLMVTFSRNGYSAFGVALAVILFFATFRSGRWQQRSILVAVLTGAMVSVALPIFTGQFAQDRMATVGKDYALRKAHWDDALDIRAPNLLTTVFGMGLGRYPESHYLLSGEGGHAGTYQLRKEGENTFLRLGAGNAMYMEQSVPIEPRQNYVLKLDVRSSRQDENIAVSLCEKWMLTSFKCIRPTMSSGHQEDVWVSLQAPIASGSLSEGPWFARKPIKFALQNPSDRFPIDVDNVRLETIGGENLLLNGDFSAGLDHWFFSADNHLQWHAKSLPIAALFDQGWFGLIAWCAISILALGRAAGNAWRGDLDAAAALASLSAFLVVGLFDTLIDAPRFLFLLLVLVWFCGSGKFSEIKERKNV